VIEGSVELIYRLWPEGVSDLWPGETHSNNSELDVTVIADVSQLVKTLNGLPLRGVKELGNLIGHTPRLIA
jgi:hypothetical protein